jgi:signal recognition particle subunit SEC65
LSKDIADATSRLGLGTLHEVQKSHPRDWENPGRVRVQWKKDGRLMNPAIKTSARIHSAKTLYSNNSNLFRKATTGDDILPDPTDKTR